MSAALANREGVLRVGSFDLGTAGLIRNPWPGHEAARPSAIGGSRVATHPD